MAGGAPFVLTTGAGVDVEKDDVTVNEFSEVLNFEGSVSVVDNGGGKTTITIGGIGAVDPFENALFDDCTPLFDKDASCNVELLEECG